MADKPIRRQPRLIYTFVVGVVAALVVNIAMEGLGDDPVRRIGFILVFASLGAAVTVLVIAGLEALWRRATSETEGIEE